MVPLAISRRAPKKRRWPFSAGCVHKMAAIADKFSRLAALKSARQAIRRPDRASLRAPDQADPLGQLPGAAVAKNHFGEHLAIRNWFSTPEYVEPSRVTLSLLSHTRDESISRKTRAALNDPSKWLFLDTETTGLAGGTGTYAFLVGLAWWDAAGLQVEQFLMRDFTDEYSMLQELATRVKERPVLLTFNGKSFDWPLLENRFKMTRSLAPPKLAAHLDLLHPARAASGSWNWSAACSMRGAWAGTARATSNPH